MKTFVSRFLTIGIAIIGMVIGKVAVQSYFDRKHEVTFDDALVKTSTQMNSKLPMQVDKYTRLDTTSPGPGNRFTYFYTLTGVEGMTPSKLLTALRPSIVNGYKTSPELASFRDNHVEIHYVYRDAAGNHFGDIVVSTEDLK